MNKLLIKVKRILPAISTQTIKNENSLVVSHEHLSFSLTILKNHINYQYRLLTSISGVDLVHTAHRFAVVYDLLSLKYNSRLRIKTFVNETTSIPSSISIFCNADWWEREIWDMFGIYFQGHSDLRRILTDYGFEGYPLRKDFPLSGFVEVSYDSIKKRISLNSLELSQEFRSFSYDTPW